MATFIKEKGLWKARRRGPDGSRKSYYGATEAEAEAKADAGDQARPGPVPSFDLAPGSVDRFVAETVAPLKRQQSKATQEQWAWAMDSFVLPAIGSRPVSSLTMADVHGVMARLDGRPPDTARTVRKHLMQLFRLLAREGHVPYNFVEEVVVAPARRRSPALSIVQARELYRSSSSTPVRVMVALGAFCGLAREEMREQDFARIKGGSCNVDRSAKKLRGGGGYRRRVVPVPLVVMRTMPATGDPWDGVGVDWMGDLLARECRRLGLPVTNVHQLRHTFASSLDMIGCPRSVSARLLGHSPRNVTDGYMTASDEALEEWIERLWRHAKDGHRKARNQTAVEVVDPRRRVYSRAM